MNNNLFGLKESYKQAYFDTAKRASAVTITEHIPFAIVSVNQSPLIKKHNVILKRILDVVISAIVSVLLLSWLLPILALLIKMDSPGPMFFIQKRNKKNGKFFFLLKA